MATQGNDGPPAGPQLVVLLRGVDAPALAAPPFAELAGPVRLPLAPSQHNSLQDPAAEFAQTLPTAELRRLGVAVDRRGLVLQPRWRSDERSVACIAARPFGPAHLTVLELRGPLQAAAIFGLGTSAVRVATAETAQRIAQARELVAARGRPTLWLVALGAPVGVAHVVDVAALVRRIVGWPHGRSLRVHAGSTRARIEAPGHRALALLRKRLPASPLAGARMHEEPDALVLSAPPCTAFGPRRAFARACLPGEGTFGMALPTAPRTEFGLDVAGLAARIAMAAAATAADRRRRALPAAPTPAPASSPLLPLGDHAGAVTQLPDLLAPSDEPDRVGPEQLER